ncbi:tRNA(Met) cytidine acetyltransferase [Palaeococcus pacificus DY20341]|uniref:tRNA(Met) cytidine acetyltransferase TmcA n=1 Tax=Palaeococcus pacificus DY20341 TaxID=1343739 RepID=A0A075LRA0_9EURY|nr:tRNA(Met) cytidine acetyltransferase TmcA [Palaeococcus pacificus]AIF68606.1 tRNA(Met) cytidine acetyltransferase [Palaeococcus pacificus DY20341]
MTVKVRFSKDVREYAKGEGVKDNLLKLTERALSEALESFHRRMIVLQGEGMEKAALAGILGGASASILSSIVSKLIEKKLRDESEDKIEVLYATDALGPETFGRKRYEEFRKHFDILAGENVNVTAVPFKYTKDILGRTFDMLILDLSYDFSPNDLGRIIETIRGGGLIFVLTNPFKKWKKMWTGFHKSLVTPPYTIDDVKKRFNRRLIRKFEEHNGIYIIKAENQKVLRKPKNSKDQAKLPDREKVIMPEEVKFPKELYELCLTKGQAEVLKSIEELADKDGMVVLTADRGRGKSVSVGISVIGLAKVSGKKKFRVVVTAPELENVQSLFRFAKKSLEKLGYKVKVVEEKGLIKELYAKGIGLRYYPPTEGYKKKADVYVLDEAAGIHVPILHKYLNKPKVIYSSTIHGYEGAGRGFSVKFLKKAKEKREFKEIHLSTPIRYASGDPIENWLFDILLLDAEPTDLTKEDYELIKRKEVKFEEPDLDEWFEGKGEDELRNFVGIYVLAHYKNRPSDVALLADAPHHEARVLRLSNGKIVTAVQIAKEGGIPKKVIDKMAQGYKPRGNIIPDMMVKHHYAKEFAKLKGYRVVRIATHPDAMDRGLGSKALELLIKEAQEKGYDWVGSGFGASEELIRFWVRNGFAPVHLSPSRNPVSGEYTAIVIKPISEKAKKIVKEANAEFRIRLLEWLGDTHKDLEPEIARWLLESPFEEAVDYPIHLTKVQKKRLELFTGKVLTYDTVLDAVKPIVKLYFLDGWMKPYLDERQIHLLIHRVLQAHTWEESAEYIGRSLTFTMIEVRDITRGLWYYYKHILNSKR